MRADQSAPDRGRSSLASRWRRLSPAIRFVAVFLVILVIMSIVYPRLSVRYNDQMLQFMAATAAVVGAGLNVLGAHVSVDGRLVIASGLSVEVIEECTGIYEIIIFWAAVLAFPSRWRAKLLGVIGGAIALLAINIARMMFLLAVGSRWPASFQFMHVYFWQATLILMIVSVWVLWIKLIANRAAR